jgi:cytochrome c-type biogenesis protein CcmH
MKPARDSLPIRLKMMAVCAVLICGVGAWAPWAVSAPAPVAPGESASGLPPEQAAELLRSERFRQLASELRCLVCQNQTLADSNAELAGDLRNEVLRQMASGKDDVQIKAHLVDRFGEFVLYRPSFSAHNLALWAGPALLAGMGLIVLWRITRRRPALAPQQVFNDADLVQVERMLEHPPDAHDAASVRSSSDAVRAQRT